MPRRGGQTAGAGAVGGIRRGDDAAGGGRHRARGSRLRTLS